MDLILLILAASPTPMMASKLAELAMRDAKAVRVTLLRLQKEGLASRAQVSTQGPQGTFVWSATKAGAAAARQVLSFVRSSGSAIAAVDSLKKMSERVNASLTPNEQKVLAQRFGVAR